MTKPKPKADAAKTPPEDTGLPITAPETPVGEGADTQPINAPDGTAPSDETPASAEDLAAAAVEAEAKAKAEEDEANAARAAAAEAEAKALAEAAEAQAAAEAAEAARAAVEAAAEAKAKEEAEAAAAAAAEPPALNLATLSHLAKTIDMLNVTGHRLGLVDELHDLYGAKTEADETTGIIEVEIEGVKGAPADSLETALANWANAARRAVTKAAA
jgi:hypothetical protein